jgi:hypothetical protein
VRSESDLGQMLMEALDVTPVANAVEASTRYGGAELRAAEQTRAEQRADRMRELRNRSSMARCLSLREAAAERLTP